MFLFMIPATNDPCLCEHGGARGSQLSSFPVTVS